MSRRSLLAVSFVISLVALAGAGGDQGLQQMMTNALARLAGAEPLREGPISDLVRSRVLIVHDASPSVRFVAPVDGGNFPGRFAVSITNWTVEPEMALPTSTGFAAGHQMHNTGHTHVWVYNYDTGQRVSFTGASGLLLDPESGLHVSRPLALPPGRYKAYVSLQNHDHTVAIPASAQSLPPIDAVWFTVGP